MIARFTRLVPVVGLALASSLTATVAVAGAATTPSSTTPSSTTTSTTTTSSTTTSSTTTSSTTPSSTPTTTPATTTVLATPGAPGASALAVSAPGNANQVFAVGQDHAVWWRQFTTSGWSSWQSFGGWATSLPTAAAAPDGSYWMFVRGGDGGLYGRRYSGSWSEWLAFGGYLSSDPVAVSTSWGVAVLVRGGDNALYWGTLDAGANWSGWRFGYGYLTSRPAAAFDGTSLHVVVRGGDGAPYWQTLGDGRGQPSGWMSLFGYLDYDPAVAWDGSALTVAVRGGDGALYWKRLTTPGWGTWQTGWGYLTSAPAIAVERSGSLLAVVRGSDTSVYAQRIANGSGQGWRPLGGSTPGAPSTSVDINGVNAYVLGYDGTTYVQRFTTGWTGYWQPLGGVPMLSLPVGSAAQAITAAPLPPLAGLGFDTCETPSTRSMATWRLASPYTSVGIYIGGANRGCPNTALNSRTWVDTVVAQGWRLIPIYVGLQAPCINFTATRMSLDPGTAALQGQAAANDASNRATIAGLPAHAPIYFDLEAYTNTDGACVAAVRSFISAWVAQMHALGRPAGMYSSLCSGILDQAAIYYNPAYHRLDAVWIAAWNNVPNTKGFTGPCGISDDLWPYHQRLHQYQGGHLETWGGVTINIDTNAVDGPLAP